MTNIHQHVNERLTVEHHPNPIHDFGPEISSLLRRASVGYLYEEHVLPLHASGTLMAALATRSLTWPSAGSRAQEAEAVAIAAIGVGKRALLAPVIAAPQHQLNLGLLAATQRSLLNALAGSGSDEVAVLVRSGSAVVQTMLAATGFRPSATVAVTDFAQYVAYCARPREILERLGIADLRQDDLLALRIEPDVMQRVASFYFTLEAAARPYFSGRPEWAEVLPGLAGWGHYQIDGGINTPSPDPKIKIEIVSNPGPA
jgi:hypothetical protein